MYIHTFFIFWCFEMDSLMSPFLEWHRHRHSSKNQAVKSLPATSPTTIPALIQTVPLAIQRGGRFRKSHEQQPRGTVDGAEISRVSPIGCIKPSKTCDNLSTGLAGFLKPSRFHPFWVDFSGETWF